MTDHLYVTIYMFFPYSSYNRFYDFDNDRSGRQIGDLKLVFLDHFQTIFHNFPDILSMILFNTSFKSYDFACTNRDMPLCGKWNVFVPYDYKAAGNLRKVAENVDSSTFSWILRGSKYFSGCQKTY